MGSNHGQCGCGQVLVAILFLFQHSHAWNERAGQVTAGFRLRGVALDKANVRNEMNLSQPNYDLYHRSDVLLGKVRVLVDRHPQIMSMEVLRAEAEGYRAEMNVVTVEAGGRGSKQDEKIRLLLDFGQHGRELVTSEVALRLLQTLGGELPLGEVDHNALMRILPHTIIKIVPMENLNGRRIVESGELCERKNGRGVDINRNWGVDWGKKEKDYDPAEEYPGTAPFSEPETVLVRDLAASFKPHIWVNVHSGMEALFMPYDHRNTVPRDGAGPMKSLLQTLNRQHCLDNCVVGSGGGSVGYLAHGTATDYMYDVLKIPMAFTWEIYGDLMQPESDCFQMFNPATPELFETVVSRWSDAFLALLVNLPRTLRSLPTRAPINPSWHWESWPSSEIGSIPDLELRQRFSLSSATINDEVKPARQWGSDPRLQARVGEDEQQMLLEFSILFAGVVIAWVSFRICRCYWSTKSHLIHVDKGKRVPV